MARRETAPRTHLADPRAIDAALELAGGDRSRLRVEPDGSVLIVNRPEDDGRQPLRQRRRRSS